MLWPLVIELIGGLSDCGVELVNGAESLAGEEMAFEVAPGALNIVEFGSVFWQPLDGQPWSFVEGGAAELAGMDWSVVEHQHDRLFEMPGSWATERVELFGQSDEIAATLGWPDCGARSSCLRHGQGHRRAPACATAQEKEMALANRRTPGPDVRQRRMGQRPGLVPRHPCIIRTFGTYCGMIQRRIGLIWLVRRLQFQRCSTWMLFRLGKIYRKIMPKPVSRAADIALSHGGSWPSFVMSWMRSRQDGHHVSCQGAFRPLEIIFNLK